jgi:hypothetical protein
MRIEIIQLGKRTYDLERALGFAGKFVPKVELMVREPPKGVIDLILAARAIPNSEVCEDLPMKDRKRDAERIVRRGADNTRSLYVDARSLQSSLYPLSRGKDVIVIHPFLMLTWHPWDSRYHARVVTFGYPSLLSIPGIVEAPARPREYYLMQMSGKRTTAELDAMFEGKFLTFEDDLTPYVGVYLLQCAFFLLFGKGSCMAPGCMLYDSHKQADLLQAPAKKLCNVHRRLADSL